MTVRLSMQGVTRGAREMAFVTASVFLFGVTFGVAARGVGMEGWTALAMSMAVFAGGSQFAALDLWQAPIPWGPLLVATFAVNARHLLLGASLYPWFSGLPPWQRYAAVTLLSDANWAQTVQAHAKGERDAGYLIGSGLVMWAAWAAGTGAGAMLATLSAAALKAFGLDLIFVTFFACILVEMRRDGRDDLPWLVAAVAAVAALWWLPPHWHVLAGGVAGGVAGVLRDAGR
ncbi:AzlC family ABC transporter permease [Azospirillum sp. TSO22-1]|uniref:AzlC family ABC transporter permease n=1 Tax=Azospirillum sp. TSO22-1 TaxID=716789 RepID=UPI000D60496A|nr:AzlC family ABC transporter permease [Azospirillum sp. TSO22-1]PWC31814.1 AzlC family protein [Azospirillum sp. TSO22-1]